MSDFVLIFYCFCFINYIPNRFLQINPRRVEQSADAKVASLSPEEVIKDIQFDPGDDACKLKPH